MQGEDAQKLSSTTTPCQFFRRSRASTNQTQQPTQQPQSIEAKQIQAGQTDIALDSTSPQPTMQNDHLACCCGPPPSSYSALNLRRSRGMQFMMIPGILLLKPCCDSLSFAIILQPFLCVNPNRGASIGGEWYAILSWGGGIFHSEIMTQ
ncbi:hypothetical protein KC19_5G114600 [Ceratodon purpureus]|uniref:Uncharacterized protein n=1 Tax=Ceratodon purpureus TaxID=3225 RepID=A0A8T0I245_CERPU|nr:hypothetical protein KC19_5G114600 [Ceratodon purpureus]